MLLTPSEVQTEPTMSGPQLFRFVCKNCDESFRWEKDLSKHRRLDCKKKPFGCPECGQLLSRRDSLRQHLQRHVGGKMFSCQYCDKLFDQQQNLKVHLRIHSGVKPYQCPECGRQFNQSQNLTTHLRVHSGEKPYVCGECGARFRFCSGYKSHITRSHTQGCSTKVPKKPITTSQPKNQVHRVSVIAKASSSSFSKPADHHNGIWNPNDSQNQRKEATGIALLSLSDGCLPLKLKYKCRVCDIECFRQLDIMRHIVEAHEFAQYDVLRRVDTPHDEET